MSSIEKRVTVKPPSATDWLRQALSAGAAASAHIKAHAAQAGVGTKALRNAREWLGVVTTRMGSGATMRSVWVLPSIRAPLASSDALLRIVNVGDLKTPVDRIAPAPTIRAAPALGCGDLDAASATHKVLTNAAYRSASSEQCADTPIEQERPRMALRVRQFVQRGMNYNLAHELAIRLVVERDRTGSKAGSCIECQCLSRATCAPGAAGHTPGPRDPAEIWMCWCARRE